MLKFYFDATPNPMKVALFLEEAGLEYEFMPIDIRRGDQFKPDFVKVNPNSKIPAIVDENVTVFDSSGILLYLAQKTDQFLPEKTPALMGEMYSWLFFISSGVGPFSGQSFHFRNVAPVPKDYPLQRYEYEAKRHWRIVEEHLAKRSFIIGDTYTIVDMSVWGWARALPMSVGEDCWEMFPRVKDHMDRISAHPAAKRAEALKDRYAFKQEFDTEAVRNLFPQTPALLQA